MCQTVPVVSQKTDPQCIILGSLNKEAKNSLYTLSVWREILHQNLNTKLLIKSSSKKSSKERMEYYIEKLDVSVERLIFIDFCEKEYHYLELFSKIDILLDTFPYSGTTTSCNALYNNIPIVTNYSRNIHSQNVSASLLIHSGFPELVAYSNDEYIKIVGELCGNPVKIDYYKSTIHGQFMDLMNPVKFMDGYEKLLEDVFSSTFA